MRIIFTDKAPKPVGSYSQAIKVGGFLFVSGQLPIDPETGKMVSGDIGTQTKIVLNNIANILKAANMDVKDVVAVYVFLRDLKLFSDFNRAYGEFFGDHKPTRVTVEVSRLPKDALLEVSVIAYRED